MSIYIGPDAQVYNSATEKAEPPPLRRKRGGGLTRKVPQ